jgi:NADH:ubiquinone oxidoreductase subunit F (NADH-binding)/(2Fe-2S) ferredoxin
MTSSTVDQATRIASPADLASLQDRLATAAEGRRRVLVCSTGCLAIGAREVEATFRSEVAAAGLEGEVEVVQTGCHGLCAMAPVAVIEPYDIVYGRNRVKYIPDVISETVMNGEVIRRFCYGRDEGMAHMEDIPFYAHQTKRVLRNVGRVDPQEINDAIQRGVYGAAAKALAGMEPDQIVEEVKTSGLRGRGGAGFPAGLKWEICKQNPGKDRYLICNADEGDPGAFMDRALLEGDPHSVLEGMIISAYAIEATKGFIYVRAEYPIAVRHIRMAIDQARERGLLGEDILGSGFSLDIEVREGAGAFVCGEETAMIASLEGERGVARPKPPYPAVRGYHGEPTIINNVETFANVPLIVNEGGAAFAGSGTAGSTGTKIFALAGQVNNTGLVEVPMGATIRDIVFDVGGGMPRNREFKAVQMGGPSGGCVPAAQLDLPIDYDSLKEVGAIMGSGGMIVMDNTTCIVDIARYFIAFCAEESCGLCAPCRLGTVQLEDILNRITDGRGTLEDLDKLESLGEVVQQTSLCGLGQTAPNPVMSTLRHFRDEYLAHVVDKTCPAGVCKALLPVEATVGKEE